MNPVSISLFFAVLVIGFILGSFFGWFECRWFYRFHPSRVRDLEKQAEIDVLIISLNERIVYDDLDGMLEVWNELHPLLH